MGGIETGISRNNIPQMFS